MASGDVTGHTTLPHHAKTARDGDPARWRRLGTTLSARLLVLLLAGRVVIFALLG